MTLTAVAHHPALVKQHCWCTFVRSELEGTLVTVGTLLPSVEEEQLHLCESARPYQHRLPHFAGLTFALPSNST